MLRNFESWTFLIHTCAGIKTLNLLAHHDLCILLVLINGNHFWNEQPPVSKLVFFEMATNVPFLCDSNDHALSSDDNFTLIYSYSGQNNHRSPTKSVCHSINRGPE